MTQKKLQTKQLTQMLRQQKQQRLTQNNRNSGIFKGQGEK
jgi:hypothetical protein